MFSLLFSNFWFCCCCCFSSTEKAGGEGCRDREEDKGEEGEGHTGTTQVGHLFPVLCWNCPCLVFVCVCVWACVCVYQWVYVCVSVCVCVFCMYVLGIASTDKTLCFINTSIIYLKKKIGGDGVVEEGCLACEDYAEGLRTHCPAAFLYFEWKAACAYQFPSFEPRIRSTTTQWAEMPWWKTALMKDHTDKRPPDEILHWWETTLMKDHPYEKPHWWETTLMKDCTDERPPL